MRKRYSKDEWDRFIAAWESSGLSQKEFCKKQGLVHQTFGKHRSRHLKIKRPEQVQAGFIELNHASSVIPSGSGHANLFSFTISKSGLQLQINMGDWFQ